LSNGTWQWLHHRSLIFLAIMLYFLPQSNTSKWALYNTQMLHFYPEKVHKNGHFSIKSMHMFLESNNTNLLNKETWHVKIPIKNKIFIWYLKNDLLVKDNLARRNWFESKTCHFYSMKKLNIRHLFLTITMLKFFGVLLSLLSELDYRQLVVLEKIRWCGEWQGERDHVWCCRPVI
jgi:hypothetical protein